MLQKPIKTPSSPFDTLEKIQNYAIRPGMLLVKPNAGVVVVSGYQLFNVDGMQIPTLKMHEIGDLTKNHTPPVNKLEANYIRLPLPFDDVGKILRTLTQPIAKKKGMWSRKGREYTSKLSEGSLISIAEVVHSIYGPNRGEDFKISNADISYSERQIGEKAIDMLAEEISVVIDFKAGEAKEFIQQLVSVSTQDGQKLIKGLNHHEKPYNPYINDELFEEKFGISIEEAMHGEGVAVSSSASLTETPRPKSQFPEVTGYIPPEIPKSQPKVHQKLPSGNKSRDIKAENRDIYDTYINDIPLKGTVRGAFLRSAKFLSPQAFELHTRMYYLPDKQSLESVAQKMGLEKADATKMHNETVETLRPHFGNNGELKRVPSFLKPLTVPQKISAQPRVTQAEPKPVQTNPKPHQALFDRYDRFAAKVVPRGLARKAFEIAVKELDDQALELHTRMYFFKGEKQTLTTVASEMGIDKATAREMHDRSVKTLLPHFEGLKHRHGFLTLLKDEIADRSQLSRTTAVDPDVTTVGWREIDGDVERVILEVPAEVFKGRQRLAVQFGQDETGRPTVSLAGEAGSKIKPRLQ